MLLLLALACVDEEKPVDTDTGAPSDTDADADTDTDTDTDSDTDTDTDSDTDADTDTDTDADTDEVVDTAVEALQEELLKDPACVAAGTSVPAHEPDMHRGRRFDPAGGRPYDPRLAGCTFSRTTLTGAPYTYTYEYDADGYAVTRTFVSGGATTVTTMLWTDDGCVDGGRELSSSGEIVYALTCDDHGYPLCYVTSREGDVSDTRRYLNTYVDDQLVEAVFEDGNFYERFRWDGDYVVSYQYPGATETYSWADGLPQSMREVTAEMAVNGSWTYDGDGRVTRFETDLSARTYHYDGAALFPYESVSDDGALVETYEVVCP